MAFKQIVFSPTGGTRKVSDAIVSAWSDTCESIDLSDQHFRGQDVVISEGDLVAIAVPDFAGRAPAVAVERLKQIRGNAAKCVVVCVYGNRAFEDGLIEIADAAADAGFRVVAGIAAIAQHSIMPQFASGRPDGNDISQLAGFGKAVLELSGDTDATEAIPGNRPYKKAGSAALVPSVNAKKCTRCGTCASTCPVGAIDFDTFIADNGECIACMRCVGICPADARSVSTMMVKAASLMIKKEASKRKDPELFA